MHFITLLFAYNLNLYAKGPAAIAAESHCIRLHLENMFSECNLMQYDPAAIAAGPFGLQIYFTSKLIL